MFSCFPAIQTTFLQQVPRTLVPSPGAATTFAPSVPRTLSPAVATDAPDVTTSPDVTVVPDVPDVHTFTPPLVPSPGSTTDAPAGPAVELRVATEFSSAQIRKGSTLVITPSGPEAYTTADGSMVLRVMWPGGSVVLSEGADVQCAGGPCITVVCEHVLPTVTPHPLAFCAHK